MSEPTKLTDEALDHVIGGARRTVHNDSCGYANVRSGPGKGYDVEYRVHNGESVSTTGRHRYKDGYEWYLLDDGNWIAGNVIGY